MLGPWRFHFSEDTQTLVYTLAYWVFSCSFLFCVSIVKVNKYFPSFFLFFLVQIITYQNNRVRSPCSCQTGFCLLRNQCTWTLDTGWSARRNSTCTSLINLLSSNYFQQMYFSYYWRPECGSPSLLFLCVPFIVRGLPNRLANFEPMSNSGRVNQMLVVQVRVYTILSIIYLCTK